MAHVLKVITDRAKRGIRRPRLHQQLCWRDRQRNHTRRVPLAYPGRFPWRRRLPFFWQAVVDGLAMVERSLELFISTVFIFILTRVHGVPYSRISSLLLSQGDCSGLGTEEMGSWIRDFCDTYVEVTDR